MKNDIRKAQKNNKPKSENSKIFDDTKIKQDEERFIKTYIENEGSAIKILARLYKGYYDKLILSAFFYIIKCSCTWFVPLITASLIDLVIERPENIKSQFIIYISIAFALYIINIPFTVLQFKYQSIANRSLEAGLRGAMIRKLQQLSISFHKEMESGRIQSKVMRDVEAIENLSNQLITTVFSVFLTVIITSTIIICKNFTIFLIFLIAIPVGVLSAMPFTKILRNQNKKFRKEMEITSSEVMDMVELVPITRAHALENREINKMTKQLTNVARKGYELDITHSIFGSVSWVTLSIFQLFSLVVCIIMAFNNKISIGDITVYTNYFSQLLLQISTVISLLPILSKGLESVNSVGEILKSYDIEDYKNKKKLTTLKGKFEFKNIFFHYNDDDRLVLKDLNLTVEAGETIALVGESGSGKSTIVNMAIGFFTPTSGDVLIDGKSIKEIDMRSLRRHIAVVPQNTILFNGTIKENITYGKSNVTKAELEKAIEAANLKHVIEKLPNGINTDIGEHGGKLSGGQRQRISIARAIIRNPDVIIFDEATSALDTVSEAEIQSAINNLSKDKTTFIVAHRLSTIRNADKIAVMRNGTCVEFGTYDELMAKKGEFYTYKVTQS